MGSPAPAPGPYPAVPAKKVSPIVWIVAGIVGLFLLIGIVMVAGGLFLAKKIADNPALVAATALAAANPDVEIVTNDPSRGTVTFREKSTGKTITLNFDQIKEGRFVFSEDGKEVSVEAGEGGLHMKGSDGSTVDIGSSSNARLPDWIPAYPGAKIEGTFAASGAAEQSATVSFTTRDSADKVLKFFEEAFKGAGLKVNNMSSSEGGKLSGGLVSGQSEDGKRQAAVTVSADGAEVNVGITYTTKK